MNKALDYIKNLISSAKNKEVKSIAILALSAILVILVITAIGVSVLSAVQKANLEQLDEDYNKDDIVIDTEMLTGTVLELTENAGQEYIDSTLFIGDSNTVRTMMYGHTTWDNVVAATSMGIQHVADLEIAFFEGYDEALTVPQAVELIQPERVIITYGTNNTIGWSTQRFIQEYKNSITLIQKAYPYADIIINAIPPIDLRRENLEVNMQTIDSFNKALSELCEELGVKFLNSSEALKDEQTGFAKTDYTIGDGIHLSKTGMQALFDYIMTHAYITEDDRPKPLNDVPNREETPTGIISEDPLAVRGARVNIFFASSDASLGSVSGEVEQSVKRTLSTESVTAQANYENGGIFIGWSVEVGSIANPASPSLVYTVPDIDDNVTQITVTANFAKVNLNIQANNSAVTELNLAQGAVEQLLLSVSNQNYENKKIIWETDNSAVVSVEQDGEITAQSIGSATITAKIDGTNLSVSCKVNVKQALSSISISGASEMATSQSTQLNLTLNPTDALADASSANWASSDSEIATVSSTGVVTSTAKEGQVTITCTLSGETAQHAIKVVAPKPLEGISINGSETIDMQEGDEQTLSVVYNPTDTTGDKTVEWKSSDTSIVTVDASGKITAIKEGSATITATVKGFTDTVTVQVSKKPNVVTGVNLDKTSITLDYQSGATDTITATAVLLDPARPAEGDTALTYSSNSDFVTVDGNGNISIVAGKTHTEATITVTITATINAKTATCTVNLTNIPITPTPPPEPTDPPAETP